ncbi:hypothetical protein GO308_17875 [Sphingomonas sp. SFZ2018-12]|uniref:hypothetical protein n=1 Tax=Sphingomonas sp. SFZ2018-12 TaxID=2683197 RepID=UPI001F0D4869|nr:hypothetical protein [Sphingomonas sp. SFZ2018-12]MCH4894975.1 hypothetical protein [Sphingomonas sp. SFZ2018-12]
MPQFGFYKVGSGIDQPLSLLVASDLDDAKRKARAAIEAERLDAVRLWIDGQQTIEVRRPGPVAKRETDDRGARMAARKAAGATYREIAAEFGVSKDRIRDLIAASERRAKSRIKEPNRSALSVRARNVLPLIIVEPETDPIERDAQLPSRVAALHKRDLKGVPNLGKQTVAELEAWLWERGLVFSG